MMVYELTKIHAPSKFKDIGLSFVVLEILWIPGENIMDWLR